MLILEGACRDLRYFSLCLDARVSYAEQFHALTPDRKLLDIFRQNKPEFESSRRFVDERKTHEGGIILDSSNSRLSNYFGNFLVDYFAATRGAGKNQLKANSYYFAIEGTKYIYGVDKKFWPWVWKDKGYVYFFSAPDISSERVWIRNVPPIPDSSFRLVKSLDEEAEKLKPNETILLQIEPQWFLYLSNQHAGG